MPQYRMSEFLRKGDIIVDPDLQNRSQNPVTKFLAKMFLDNFEPYTFEFNGVVGFIFIDEGDIYKDFLSGNLCRETIEEVQRSGEEPTVVARMRFEAAGPDRNLTFKILVEPIRRRWNQLPPWWHDFPKGDVHRLVSAIEANLQRREPLGGIPGHP